MLKQFDDLRIETEISAKVSAVFNVLKRDKIIAYSCQDRHCLLANRQGVDRWIGWRRQKQREWRRKNALSVFSFALCLQISASPQSLSDILCAQPSLLSPEHG